MTIALTPSERTKAIIKMIHSRQKYRMKKSDVEFEYAIFRLGISPKINREHVE